MDGLSKLKITYEHEGLAVGSPRIYLNGVDVTHSLSGYEIKHDVQDFIIPVVTLTLPPDGVEIDSEVFVVLQDAASRTAKSRVEMAKRKVAEAQQELEKLKEIQP